MHEGAPKVWYALPPNQRALLEKILEIYFQAEANNCKNFLN